MRVDSDRELPGLRVTCRSWSARRLPGDSWRTGRDLGADPPRRLWSGTIAAGVFVADPGRGFPPGTPVKSAGLSRAGILHFVSGGIGFYALIAACFVFGWRFLRERQPGWAIYCAATGVLFSSHSRPSRRALPRQRQCSHFTARSPGFGRGTRPCSRDSSSTRGVTRLRE